MPLCCAFPRTLLSSLIISRLNAGLSLGLRLVTKPRSTTTSSSTQSAPAFRRSVFSDGHDVVRRPRGAGFNHHPGAWQIEATGLPVSKNAFTNSTAFGWILSASGISDVSIIDDHQHQMRVGDLTIDRMA